MAKFWLEGIEIETRFKKLRGLTIKRMSRSQRDCGEHWTLFMEMPDDEPDKQITDKQAVLVNGVRFYMVPPAVFGSEIKTCRHSADLSSFETESSTITATESLSQVL
jgi:hypothetical protein